VNHAQMVTDPFGRPRTASHDMARCAYPYTASTGSVWPSRARSEGASLDSTRGKSPVR
jgi:hypothetical protein